MNQILCSIYLFTYAHGRAQAKWKDFIESGNAARRNDTTSRVNVWSAVAKALTRSLPVRGKKGKINCKPPPTSAEASSSGSAPPGFPRCARSRRLCEVGELVVQVAAVETVCVVASCRVTSDGAGKDRVNRARVDNEWQSLSSLRAMSVNFKDEKAE